MNSIKLILTLVVFVIFTFEPYAQSHKSGDYYYKVATFDRAIKEYTRELRKNNNDKKTLEKIVSAYLLSNVDRSEALPYIEKLLQSERNSKYVLMHGKVLFYGEMFEEAMAEFEWVKDNTQIDSEEYNDADKYIKWTLNAQALISSPLDVEFLNLGRGINTNKSELNPFITSDEEALVYSTDKKYNSYAGANYYNVSMSLRESNKWDKGKYLSSDINSQFDEIVAGYSGDGNHLFVFHNRDKSEKVGYSEYEGDRKFTALKEFGYPIDKKGGEYGVCFSYSSDTIFFASENVEGNTDIYYSILLPNGEYGEPRELPGLVNTSYDENFSMVTNGGKRLYFSSNCESSMGGYDLFYSDYDEHEKEWGKPVNLGYPINDLYDNYTISFSGDGRYAYVSDVRDDSYGERDIYKIIFKEKSPTNLIMKCRIRMDTDTGTIIPPCSMSVVVSDQNNSEELGRYKCTTDSAQFILALTPGKYLLSFKADGNVLMQSPIDVDEMYYKQEALYKDFIIPKVQEPTAAK